MGLRAGVAGFVVEDDEHVESGDDSDYEGQGGRGPKRKIFVIDSDDDDLPLRSRRARVKRYVVESDEEPEVA